MLLDLSSEEPLLINSAGVGKSDYSNWLKIRSQSTNLTQRCFYINLPIGGVSAGVIFAFFHVPVAITHKVDLKEKLLQMDLLGTALMMGAIVSLLLAFQYGGQTLTWRSPTVIGLLVGFVIILAAFSLWTAFQGERSVVPPRLIRQRKVFVSGIFAFTLIGGYYLVLYSLPIYFQSVDNATATESGIKNIPLIISVSICTIVSGVLISTHGFTVPIQITSTVIVAIGSGLLYTLETTSSLGKAIGFQLLCGIGWGLAIQSHIIAVQASVPDEDISSATSIVLRKSRHSPNEISEPAFLQK